MRLYRQVYYSFPLLRPCYHTTQTRYKIILYAHVQQTVEMLNKPERICKMMTKCFECSGFRNLTVWVQSPLDRCRDLRSHIPKQSWTWEHFYITPSSYISRGPHNITTDRMDMSDFCTKTNSCFSRGTSYDSSVH